MLGGVLFAYRSTSHQSTGMSPFHLLYGHDPKLPSALDFQAPVSKFPTIESEYGWELVGELKNARDVANQNVQKKQREQKKFYDRHCKEVDLRVNDLVMLKTQPRFCLDCKYKGPFIIKAVTPIYTFERSPNRNTYQRGLSLKALILHWSTLYTGFTLPQHITGHSLPIIVLF